MTGIKEQGSPNSDWVISKGVFALLNRFSPKLKKPRIRAEVMKAATSETTYLLNRRLQAVAIIKAGPLCEGATSGNVETSEKEVKSMKFSRRSRTVDRNNSTSYLGHPRRNDTLSDLRILCASN
jgi:hypothetical protein